LKCAEMASNSDLAFSGCFLSFQLLNVTSKSEFAGKN
jgi:hypothetical protein